MSEKMLDYLLSDVQAVKKQLDFMQNNFISMEQNFKKKAKADKRKIKKLKKEVTKIKNEMQKFDKCKQEAKEQQPSPKSTKKIVINVEKDNLEIKKTILKDGEFYINFILKGWNKTGSGEGIKLVADLNSTEFMQIRNLFLDQNINQSIINKKILQIIRTEKISIRSAYEKSQKTVGDLEKIVRGRMLTCWTKVTEIKNINKIKQVIDEMDEKDWVAMKNWIDDEKKISGKRRASEVNFPEPAFKKIINLVEYEMNEKKDESEEILDTPLENTKELENTAEEILNECEQNAKSTENATSDKNEISKKKGKKVDKSKKKEISQKESDKEIHEVRTSRSKRNSKNPV